MATRTVEFYLLLVDQTWTTETVDLKGPETELSDAEAEQLARAKLDAACADLAHVECVGPLYYLAEVEEDEPEDP